MAQGRTSHRAATTTGRTGLMYMIDIFYAWVIKKRNPIVNCFKVFFILLTLFLCVGSWAIYSNTNFSFYYEIGKKCGDIAILLFILSSIPGIVRRFGKFNKLISILMIFRRYIGITTYLFVLIHLSFVRVVPWISGLILPIPEVYVLIGMLANMMLFLLFVTSNDLSVKKLGHVWHVIHNWMYVIVWIIFLHVALQRISIWTVLIGSTAIAQVCSFLRRLSQ
jgi:DMSO/TMAO reductase YedYZ heme-binding membrane subunit